MSDSIRTGEDVMLAVYHPGNYRPSGVIKSSALNHYMTEILDTPDLNALTEARFCIDTVGLKGMDWEMVSSDNARPKLVIHYEKSANTHAEIVASTDYVTFFKKEKPVKTISLGSVAVFVEPLGHFFIPRNLGTILPEEF
jgi:alkaline phosphatase